MAPDLDSMEVNIGQQLVTVYLDALQEDYQLFKRLLLEDCIFEAHEHAHSEVKDEVLVSLKKKDLPQFVKQAEFNDSRVQCGDQARGVHFNLDVLATQMTGYLHVSVGQEQVSDSQAASKVRQFIASSIKLVMQVVWDETLDESFEEGVDTGQIKALTFVRRAVSLDLAHLIAEVFDRASCTWELRWSKRMQFIAIFTR